MSDTIVIPGHVVGATTVEVEKPFPAEVSRVEVVVHLTDRAPSTERTIGEWVRQLPPGTRSEEDILGQFREERDSWRS